MTLRSSLRRATTLVAGLALTAGLAATAPVGAAQADAGSPPVAVDDVVEVVAGRPTPVDLLANDSDADGDELAVCRLGDVPRRLDVHTEGSEMYIFAMTSKARTFTFTYYACDYASLTPATVTVNVVEAPKVRIRVRKTERPGHLRVTNRSDFALRFLWGSIEEEEPDGEVRISRHATKVVEVERRSLIWLAYNQRREVGRLGVVRGIELPEGTRPLPPGAPTGDISGMVGRRITQGWGTP